MYSVLLTKLELAPTESSPLSGRIDAKAVTPPDSLLSLDNGIYLYLEPLFSLCNFSDARKCRDSR